MQIIGRMEFHLKNMDMILINIVEQKYMKEMHILVKIQNVKDVHPNWILIILIMIRKIMLNKISYLFALLVIRKQTLIEICGKNSIKT